MLDGDTNTRKDTHCGQTLSQLRKAADAAFKTVESGPMNELRRRVEEDKRDPRARDRLKRYNTTGPFLPSLPPTSPLPPALTLPSIFFQHDLVITGPGIWAVSEEHAQMRSKWQLIYNEVLEGSGVEIIRVTLDPKFPTEKKIRCRTEKTKGETKAALLGSFLRKQGVIDNVWDPADYAEVVVHGVAVP